MFFQHSAFLFVGLPKSSKIRHDSGTQIREERLGKREMGYMVIKEIL